MKSGRRSKYVRRRRRQRARYQRRAQALHKGLKPSLDVVLPVAPKFSAIMTEVIASNQSI